MVVLWVLYNAGLYQQLFGHDVMIHAVSTGNYLCLDAYYDSGTYYSENNFAIARDCDPKNVNQQWRIIGETVPCVLQTAYASAEACSAVVLTQAVHSIAFAPAFGRGAWWN
jgi:hypothetical protein